MATCIRRASPGGMWSTTNALHMALNSLVIYICSVNILCADVVNSTHSMSNFLWLRYVFQSLFSIVGQRILLKIVCAIDRLKLWKHCFHFVSFPVVVWSQRVSCLALHKNDVCALSSNLILKPFFFYLWSISVKRKCKCLKSSTYWSQIHNE